MDRDELIATANGYFDTLENNTGDLRGVAFSPDATRFENGKEFGEIEAGFRSGRYRFNERVRDRDFFLVDEARGIVMARAFIDHKGLLDEYRLTDGTTGALAVPRAAELGTARDVQDQGGPNHRGRGDLHPGALLHALALDNGGRDAARRPRYSCFPPPSIQTGRHQSPFEGCRMIDAVVETRSGKLRGVVLDGIWAFKGIRYATAERFMPPEPVVPWAGVRDAIDYGPIAPQTNPNPAPGRPPVILAQFPRPAAPPAPPPRKRGLPVAQRLDARAAINAAVR